MPAVKGWEGRTLHAQVKISFNKGREVSLYPLLPGSLYKSQRRIRLSFLKLLSMSFTYFSNTPHLVLSLCTVCEGLRIHPLLWMPGLGPGCLPYRGSGF